MKTIIFIVLALPLFSFAQDKEANFVTDSELDEIFYPSDPEIIPSDLVIVVDKAEKNSSSTSQSLKVYRRVEFDHDYKEVFNFVVSTGSQTKKKPKRGGVYYAGTPIGAHRIQRMLPKYKSIKWQAVLPYVMFFNGGIAIHGTTPDHFKELGKRDSGGCVRLHPKDAKKLYEYIKKNFKEQTVTKFARGGQPLKSKKGTLLTEKALNIMVVIMNRDPENPLDTI